MAFAGSFPRYLPSLEPLGKMTWVGVDLFFVLSGYLLGRTLFLNRNKDLFFLAFYGRRALRILPLYWLILALVFLLNDTGSEKIWPYLLFTQNIGWAFEGRWGPFGLEATWSLAVEEQFYLLLPFVIRYCPHKYVPYLLGAAIATAPALRYICHASGYPYAAYSLMPCRMDALFAGVLAAWFNLNYSYSCRRNSKAIFLALTLSGLSFFGLLLLQDLYPLSFWMSVVGHSVIACFFSVGFLLVSNTPEPQTSIVSFILQILAFFGRGAYSIYLFHIPIVILIYATFGISLTTKVAAVLAVFALSWITWKFVEEPCIRLGHKLFPYASEDLIVGNRATSAEPTEKP
jgi:peptidoglycan/LPS O-acetylase OafA/YrhL